MCGRLVLFGAAACLLAAGKLASSDAVARCGRRNRRSRARGRVASAINLV